MSRTWTIPQTLHGYDGGHHLLASGGNLSEDETQALDRLSDLSGYLPDGVEFESFHSGFPCGRYYAISRTWPDRLAKRGGTVLTHTLLLPLGSLEHLTDPCALPFRKPIDAEDRDAYKTLATFHVDTLSPVVVEESLRRAAVTLFFGMPERPILWLDVQERAEVVDWLWSRMWPEWRKEFAFCTLALQTRTIKRRPFDFLRVPPQAQSAFHDQARLPSWWATSGSKGTQARTASSADWITSVIAENTNLPLELRTWVYQHGLPVDDLKPTDLQLLIRLPDLEERAPARLTSARAFIDTIGRLWPDLPAHHPVWHTAIHYLLNRLGESPLEPRPLFDLTLAASHKVIRAMVTTDGGENLSLWFGVLESELRRRMEMQPDQVLEQWDPLLAAATDPRELEVVGRVAGGWIQAASSGLEEQERALRVSTHALTHGYTHLVSVAFQSLRSPGRCTVLRQMVTSQPQVADQCLELASQLATSEHDIRLAQAVRELQGDPARGLPLVEEMALRTDPPEFEPLREQLARLDDEKVVQWALHVTDRRLIEVVREVGARVVGHKMLEGSQWVTLCQSAPLGLPLYLASVSGKNEGKLRKELEGAPDFVSALLGHFAKAHDEIPFQLLRALLATLPATTYSSPDVLFQLLETADHRGQKEIVESCWRKVLVAGLRGDLAPTSCHRWFSMREVAQVVDKLSDAHIRDVLAKPPRGAILRLVEVALVPTPQHSDLVIRLLGSLIVVGSSKEELELAHVALLRLFDPWQQDNAWLWLASEVAWATLKYRPQHGHEVLARLFVPVYRAIGRDLGVLKQTSWSASMGWDRCKAWRHRLVDTWAQTTWPGDALAAIAEQDRELAEKIAKRASKGDENRASLEPRLRNSAHRQGWFEVILKYWFPWW